jgi:hypothetical protein
VLNQGVEGREILGAQGHLQHSVGEMGALFAARLLGREAPAKNPPILDDFGERNPHIGV